MISNEKNILIITGSFPPDVCGVGDYTNLLTKELSKTPNIRTSIFYKKSWGLKNVFNYRNEIKKLRPDIIHLQYPTEGFGYSFLPFLLLCFFSKSKIILTLHEVSSRTFKALLFTYILTLRARSIIVSNIFEMKYLQNYFLIRRDRLHVINIGSNIPKSPLSNKNIKEREFDLCYFGHLRPNKGIEAFVEVVKILKQKDKIKFSPIIIGQSLNKYNNFFNTIKKEAERLNIKILSNNEVEKVSDLLSSTKIAFLPFPDGISVRRGSLIASGINGCLIVSTYSNNEVTNLFFRDHCYLVKDVNEAVSTLEDILNGIIEYKYPSTLFDSFSWEEISQQHLCVYLK